MPKYSKHMKNTLQFNDKYINEFVYHLFELQNLFRKLKIPFT